MKKHIYEITPFTTVDFSGKIASILWFKGCNMRCIYCYNKEVVNSNGRYEINKILEFLNSRVNKLDGVVFSGGECTICTEFFEILRAVKNLGFLIKIDTNGSKSEILKEAIKDNLIDYVALDFKATKEKFNLITNSNFYDEFLKSLRILINSNLDFEVRTTIHSDFLDEKDIEKMAKILEDEGYKNNYYLQNFLYTDDNFGRLNRPNSHFDITKINTKLNLILRNF